MILTFTLLLVTFCFNYNTFADVAENDFQIWGPGLEPDKIIMPARYFFVRQFNKRNESSVLDLHIKIEGTNARSKACRIWVNVLPLRDEQDTLSLCIVRYKLYETCFDLKISVRFEDRHLGKSPYLIHERVYPDECNCETKDRADDWLSKWKCEAVPPHQITSDLATFKDIDFVKFRQKIVQKYNNANANSLCHYVIKGNKIFRKCYGKYVGFKMFVDDILLSLSRKLTLPNVEFFFNLGDWPLVKETPPVPIFSWCGSYDSYDIVVPTYDITQSTLENMGGVTMDMLSVQGNSKTAWNDRIPKLFWRGRDSSRHRLHLIDLSREEPNLFNVSLTNFFFFRNEEAKYGPKSDHVSFFNFFDYKYQLNIDGTVAAYRFPYLLGGGSLIFKQQSKYYEHFYGQLQEYVHYIPVEENLSDLVEKIRWAQNEDNKSRTIAQNALEFARAFLLPKNIFCYYVHLLNEFSKKITSKIDVLDDMEHVTPKKNRYDNGDNCNCLTKIDKEEL